MFLRIHALDLADTLYGALLKSVAAQGVSGIGWENNYSAAVQYVQNAVQIALAGVLFIKSYQHMLSFI